MKKLIHFILFAIFISLTSLNAQALSCKALLNFNPLATLETSTFAELETMLDSIEDVEWTKAADAYESYISKFTKEELIENGGLSAPIHVASIKRNNKEPRLVRMLFIKDLVQEAFRVGMMMLPKRQNSLPVFGFYSRIKAQVLITLLFKKIFDGSPEMERLKNKLAQWVGEFENEMIQATEIFPKIPSEVEGEYWDFATGVIPITLRAIKGSDPERAHRYFDFSPYVVTRINHLLADQGLDSSEATLADLSKLGAFSPHKDIKLAGFRIKNTSGYIPQFLMHVPVLIEKLEVGGQIHLQFINEEEKERVLEDMADALEGVKDWPLEITDEYDDFTTYIYTKP